MLHDQSIVAGIGNIYSDEILYLCSIYPETKYTELTVGEAVAIARSVREFDEKYDVILARWLCRMYFPIWRLYGKHHTGTESHDRRRGEGPSVSHRKESGSTGVLKKRAEGLEAG